MTLRTEVQLVCRRDKGRLWLTFATAVASSSANYLALLVIGLLVVTGCGWLITGTPMERAQAYLDAGKWDDAVAACSDAIAQHPEDRAAYMLRGRAYHLAGRYDEAVVDLTDAIRLNSQDPEAYYQRAHAYRALGKMDLKNEDDIKGRQLDSTYTYDFKPDGTLQRDPALDIDVLGSESAEQTADKKSAGPDFDGLTSDGTDDQPKRSVVEEMFGLPPETMERDRPRTPPATASRTWDSPSEPESPPAARGEPSSTNPVVGKSQGSKPATAAGRTDRAGKSPAARKGRAGVAEQPAAPASRQQAANAQQRGAAGAAGAAGSTAATGQQNPGQYRNLRPYAPSSMRPTGLQDPQPLIDPYGGLSASRGRAATVGSHYVPPSRGPGSVPRTAAPTGSATPAPPGNRYDGGRGYGF